MKSYYGGSEEMDTCELQPSSDIPVQTSGEDIPWAAITGTKCEPLI